MSLSLIEPALDPTKQKLSVKILGIGTALPSLKITQKELLDFVLKHFKIKKETQILYKKILSNPSIQTRYFSLDNLEQALEKNHDKINLRFQKAAVELSTRSLNSALQKSGLSSKDLDYIVAATCTGYLCPGLSSYLVESCQLKRDIQQVDLVGMGCGAALPAIEQASNFLKSHPGKTAAVICTEICSAALFSNDDPDIVVSNSIFADGSAALILKSTESKFDSQPVSNDTIQHPRIRQFASLIVPEWRDTLRFELENGYLKNRLAIQVPEQAAEAINKLAETLLNNELINRDKVTWVFHAGGEKVLQSIQNKMNFKNDQLKFSRNVLQDCGNMSSPTVLFVLEKYLNETKIKPGSTAFMASFGAGFSAYAALLEF